MAKETGLLSFERYYWRNESTASLTIMLTEHDNIQTADVIASAGGRGIFNISRGANSDFAQDASDILERHGFKKEQEKKY